MKATATALTLVLACLPLCQCVRRSQDANGWSLNPTKRGQPLFEGARMGWSVPVDDGEP